MHLSLHWQGPCHVSLDASESFLLVANYETGHVASLPLLEDGSLGPACSVLQHGDGRCVMLDCNTLCFVSQLVLSCRIVHLCPSCTFVELPALNCTTSARAGTSIHLGTVPKLIPVWHTMSNESS